MPVPRVLVTRPEPLAEELAEALRYCGAEVVVCPFLTIEPMQAPYPTIDEPFVIALTSRMALASSRELTPFLDKTCYCVGEKTALAARQTGFRDIHIGSGNGLSLAGLIVSEQSEKVSVLHIGALESDADFGLALSHAGYDYARWAVYRSVAPALFPPELAARLRGGGIDVATFLSARTAQTFVTLAQKACIEPCFSQIVAVALSDKVARALAPLPWKKLAVAARPDQTALIDCFVSSQG